MNVSTKKTVLILLITAIMTSAMLVVYADFLKHKGPEKKLLDGSVLIVYPGISGETKPTSNENTYGFFFQSFYSLNAADLKILPPVLYKYHTIILLNPVSDDEIINHKNVIYLYSENKCIDWKFENVTNGIKINCDPNGIILDDVKLQNYIYDYITSSKVDTSEPDIIPKFEKLK